jgi:hypothetical protein
VFGFRARVVSHQTIFVEKLGSNISCNRKQERNFEFIANLSPKGDPNLPNKLSWYPFEPMWQMVSQGRLQYGLKDFALNVNCLEDFGINADLNTSIKNVGLQIGGNFVKHESTIWKITGNFADIKTVNVVQ